MEEELKQTLKKQQYHFAGKHSAVKICGWTKKSLLDEGVCYKEKFYGVSSHRCCQMTPCFICDMECIFCWRNMEAHTGMKMEEDIDAPEEIIENCIKGQRKLLNGFPGNKKINMNKFKEAQNPDQWAISLTGEPTIYPKIKELINTLYKRGSTTFVVSNGMFPEKLKEIRPTQLYMSLDAPNKEIFQKVNMPIQKDAWDKLNKSLSVLRQLRDKTRTVLRITLVKGVNDIDIDGYANLIRKADPKFIEVKAYMFVGSSRHRLSIDNMPRHKEVKEFTKKLAEKLGWKLIDESSASRVCLLAKEDWQDRLIR